MPLSASERTALRRRCTRILPGFVAPTPAEEFRLVADWCERHDVAHDSYGEGELVGGLEHKLASLLGKPSAVFMPSGVMAQLIAVKLWTERARLPRFGMHPTSHLIGHEEQAYASLMQLHGVPLGDRLRPLLAADLAGARQPLACLLVELPIREAGGQLPSWDELEALKAEARTRGVFLHMDGARLWESAAYYDRPHAQIAAGFDSVYVSLYKGIGAFAGAVLAGDEDFIANARLWRRRLGGTLYHMSPMVAAAAMRLDERLAMMPALYRRTLSFAQHLRTLPALRVNPAVPQANMLHLHLPATAARVLEARDAVAQESGWWLLDGVRETEVPGWSVSELYVGERLLGIDDDEAVPMFGRLLQRLA